MVSDFSKFYFTKLIDQLSWRGCASYFFLADAIFFVAEGLSFVTDAVFFVAGGLSFVTDAIFFLVTSVFFLVIAIFFLVTAIFLLFQAFFYRYGVNWNADNTDWTDFHGFFFSQSRKGHNDFFIGMV